jgi:hypothetical protein
MVYKPKGVGEMSYEEFKTIIKEELERAPEGLTWTQIREKRPELYQRWPANQWVHRMELDISLIRENVKGKPVWRINK